MFVVFLLKTDGYQANLVTLTSFSASHHNHGDGQLIIELLHIRVESAHPISKLNRFSQLFIIWRGQSGGFDLAGILAPGAHTHSPTL